MGLQLGIAPLSRAENASQWQRIHSTCAKLVWAQFSASKEKIKNNEIAAGTMENEQFRTCRVK